MSAEPTQDDQSTHFPYFRHVIRPAGGTESAPMQNATRYLCAAAYLDKSFAGQVIKELLTEQHRGVVPSYGFDAEPVIAHCLRGQRLQLIRDLLLTGVTVLTFVLIPAGLIVYLAAILVFALGVRTIRQRTSSWLWRIGKSIISLTALFVLVLAAIYAAGQQAESPIGIMPAPPLGASSGSSGPLAILLLFSAAIAAIAIGYRVVVYQTLSDTLQPGSRAAAPPVGNPQWRQRIDDVAAAQRGNITLYSGDNPFLGAGKVTDPWARVWSIVIELDRKAARPLQAGVAEQPKRVDPVALHEHIRRRLAAMRDEFAPIPPPRAGGAAGATGAADPDQLPPNERIAGLVVDYHVVARGECVQRRRPVDLGTDLPQYAGHPLIDPALGVPFSQATPEGVEAIIRWPQGGIRCYQRVTIGAHGQAIKDRYGRPVAPAEDQDVVLSAFIYLAVEGRMLYGQFVATVMPPIRRAFRVVDVLPSYSTGQILLQAITEEGLGALTSAITGPIRAIVSVGRMIGAALRITDSPRERLRFTVYDYGARLSIRQRAADRRFHTFMQELDVDKYTKLVERRLNEAVLDYLDNECQIDTSQYRQQASMIMNSGVIITGGTVNGQVAAGVQVSQDQSTAKQ
jgi:hypothetical protein